MGRAGGDPANKARGYKAALKNPRVSQSAKEHARQVLDQEYEGGAASSSDEEKKPTNVIRGLKAAIHNPNVTDYGKMQARKKMEDMGVEPEQPGD
ncbi:Conidiation protein 6-domain-containing protein [Thermoascus aurantiacus ATCC 26904]